jgi:hypothetical protein
LCRASSGVSVVLVDEAAEAVAATNLPDGRCRCRRWLARLRGSEVERAVWPLRVVVLKVDAQDALEVAAVEDQQPVEAFGAGGSDEPLGDGVCLRRPHGRLDTRMAALRNTSSNEPVYLLSRSQISKRIPWSAKSKPSLRACWVTQAPVGVRRAAGQPHASASCVIKNRTQ